MAWELQWWCLQHAGTAAADIIDSWQLDFPLAPLSRSLTNIILEYFLKVCNSCFPNRSCDNQPLHKLNYYTCYIHFNQFKMWRKSLVTIKNNFVCIYMNFSAFCKQKIMCLAPEDFKSIEFDASNLALVSPIWWHVYEILLVRRKCQNLSCNSRQKWKIFLLFCLYFG